MYPTRNTEYDEAMEQVGRNALGDVLTRGIARLTEQLGTLEDRIRPVLSMTDSASKDTQPGPPNPHSSELASHIYEIHRLADRINEITHRVEL